jgi:hypothetical protein
VIEELAGLSTSTEFERREPAGLQELSIDNGYDHVYLKYRGTEFLVGFEKRTAFLHVNL